MTRMTLQYFFMVLKSFSITLLPSSSAQRLEALEKAFFLDLHLYVQTSMGMVDETEARMGKPNLISNDMLSGEKALRGVTPVRSVPHELQMLLNKFTN